MADPFAGRRWGHRCESRRARNFDCLRGRFLCRRSSVRAMRVRSLASRTASPLPGTLRRPVVPSSRRPVVLPSRRPAVLPSRRPAVLPSCCPRRPASLLCRCAAVLPSRRPRCAAALPSCCPAVMPPQGPCPPSFRPIARRPVAASLPCRRLGASLPHRPVARRLLAPWPVRFWPRGLSPLRRLAVLLPVRTGGCGVYQLLEELDARQRCVGVMRI
jgi:hypothetical protein